MGTEAARAIYKLRGQTAEWVNAMCRERALSRLPVRGLVKCRIVATLYAITHNLMRQGNVRGAAAAAKGWGERGQKKGKRLCSKNAGQEWHTVR
jgi:Transposase DDE domain